MSSPPESALFRAWLGMVAAGARPLLRRAARTALQGRPHDPAAAEEGRWQRRDVDAFLGETWSQVSRLLPAARLAELPTYGNRLNVFMAVVTTAAYRALLERGLPPDDAASLVADIGWKVYGWMLAASALPARLLTRSPRHRLEWTLRMLMHFPFSAPGKPGYEVEAWSNGEDFYTSWTHCPPQTFVRGLVEAGEDRGELAAFRRSWCSYDWAGADLIVGDGERGHYDRPHTLSHGDAVCDMCWRARSSKALAPASRP